MIVAATARFIDGKTHVVTVAEVGMNSASAVASSFRQACECRGWAAETKINGDSITLRSVPISEAMNRRGPYRQVLPERKPQQKESIESLTARYLRTTPGTPQAIILSSKLVEITRPSF